MNNTRQKRAPARKPKATVATQIGELRNELKELRQELRRAVFRAGASTDETRFLKESDAARYELLSARLRDWEDTIAFCELHFRELIERSLQEEIHLLTLNSGYCVIQSHQLVVGLLNSAPLHAREVFRPAIADSAQSIILVHNHPSGNFEPSREDLKITECIEAAGKIVGIPLIDHIVVARNGSASIFEWRKK